MTKKHFIDLADRIRAANERRTLAGLPLCFEPAAIGELADFCKAANPHFNRQRWLDYIEGRCGSGGGKVDTHPRTGMAIENDALLSA